MSLVNRYNFLRWDDGVAASSIEGPIPNGYEKNATACDYKPLLVSTEAMRFFINALNGLSFIPSSGDTHTLALVNANTGSVQNASIASLQTLTFVDGNGDTVRTYYAEVIIDGTVPAGDYVYQIKQSSTVRLTSNRFTVVASTSDYRSYTTLAKFRHDRYFYGINYQDLLTFYQQFRIHLNMSDLQFENDREVYKEMTTGKARTFNNFMAQLLKAETYYFDNYAHEAAAVMFDSDELFLNLKRYTPKAVYRVNFAPLSKISKGEIELYSEEFASVNRCAG